VRLKTFRRILTAAAIGYAFALRRLESQPSDLLDLEWHLEAPMRLTMLGLTRLLPWLYRTRGEAGVKALQYVFYQVGLDRAALLKECLEIDLNDARSLGRVLDYEDGMVGVRGVWTEECVGRAVKEERRCPASRELAACPEVCTRLMMAMEAGTFAALGAGIKVPAITKLLSRGDDCCLAVIELEGEGGGSGEVSPQATPGQFPPVLKVPGLRLRLVALGMASLIKAIVKLSTSGPDQPMEWYEFFRYAPE